MNAGEQVETGHSTDSQPGRKDVNVPLWLPIIVMAGGLILILRATFIVATKGAGRFRADPLVTIVLGFGLIQLAQYLLR